MRFSAIAAALLPGVLARGLSLFGDQGAIANADLKIPGESPLELCDTNHDDDIVRITSVDLLPNPPEAGKELVIKAVGTVSETIEAGAYVNLQVKYGLIRLISTKADLCEQVKNVDMDCPIEKGKVSIVKSVDIPREIPPGKYTVLADVYTADDRAITCLTATVQFGGKKSETEPNDDL